MKSEEDSDEDDEVVRELDVFLSKSLCGHLYMLQYPVQNAARKYGIQDRSVARVKPKNNKVEMDVSLDISSPNYDQSKGEQIALNVDGNASTVQPSTTFETNVMDKQTLQSTSIPSRGKRYVAGVIQNGELHLTPISHVLQLHPSFKYMDRAEHRASQAAKAKAMVDADSSQDEAEDAKAVTIRFKGAETEAARLARERSYAAYEKRLAEEKWITTQFHHKKESYAERERQRLISQSSRQQGYVKVEAGATSTGFSEMVKTPSEYLSDLVPVYAEQAVDNSCLPTNVLSITLLKNETLADQLKLLMKNAKIIRFSHLMSLLPKPPDISTVVRSLQSFAVLVKGFWIVKSDVLFPAGTQSPISGIPSENLCVARDYILYLFTKADFVVRKEVTSTVKIPGEDVKAILEDVAVMRMGQGWQLRLMPDTEFMKRFPEVCERQGMLWAAQGTKLSKVLDLHTLEKEMGAVSVTKTKDRLVSPPRKKKANQQEQTSNAAKQQNKTAKRQRKKSGHKESPDRHASVKSGKVKSNLGSPPKAGEVEARTDLTSKDLNSQPKAALTRLNSQSNSDISLPKELQYPEQHTVSPVSNPSPMVTNQTNTALRSPKINVAGVNSTVQLIANEMIKMGSPDRQQYYIPQMIISNQYGNTQNPMTIADPVVANEVEHNSATLPSQGQSTNNIHNVSDQNGAS